MMSEIHEEHAKEAENLTDHSELVLYDLPTRTGINGHGK